MPKDIDGYHLPFHVADAGDRAEAGLAEVGRTQWDADAIRDARTAIQVMIDRCGETSGALGLAQRFADGDRDAMRAWRSNPPTLRQDSVADQLGLCLVIALVDPPDALRIAVHSTARHMAAGMVEGATGIHPRHLEWRAVFDPCEHSDDDLAMARFVRDGIVTGLVRYWHAETVSTASMRFPAPMLDDAWPDED